MINYNVHRPKEVSKRALGCVRGGRALWGELDRFCACTEGGWGEELEGSDGMWQKRSKKRLWGETIGIWGGYCGNLRQWKFLGIYGVTYWGLLGMEITEPVLAMFCRQARFSVVRLILVWEILNTFSPMLPNFSNLFFKHLFDI